MDTDAQSCLNLHRIRGTSAHGWLAAGLQPSNQGSYTLPVVQIQLFLLLK